MRRYINHDEHKSTEKVFVEQIIHDQQGDEPFTWADIKNLTLEDADVILMGLETGDESNDWRGHYYIQISRSVIETDEEFEERQADNLRNATWAKDRRYENYLKLKQEFENISTSAK